MTRAGGRGCPEGRPGGTTSRAQLLGDEAPLTEIPSRPRHGAQPDPWVMVGPGRRWVGARRQIPGSDGLARQIGAIFRESWPTEAHEGRWTWGANGLTWGADKPRAQLLGGTQAQQAAAPKGSDGLCGDGMGGWPCAEITLREGTPGGADSSCPRGRGGDRRTTSARCVPRCSRIAPVASSPSPARPVE